MKVVKMIIDKILSLFKKNNNLLLSDNNKSNIIESDLDRLLAKDIIDNNEFEENIKIPNRYTKEEFFAMYNNYKEGKIDKSKILISDLIAIELMIQKESDEYKKKLEEEQLIVNNQISKIKELENKKSLLESNKLLQNNT